MPIDIDGIGNLLSLLRLYKFRIFRRKKNNTQRNTLFFICKIVCVCVIGVYVCHINVLPSIEMKKKKK